MDHAMILQLLQMMQGSGEGQEPPKNLMQMMIPFLPPEGREFFLKYQEIAELKQLIAAHAANERGWRGHHSMLCAVRPRLPEENRHAVDVLIKCAELGMLLEGRDHHGH